MVTKERPEGVTDWVTYIGNAGPRFILSHNPKAASSNYALMILNVNAVPEITRFMKKMNTYVVNHHPDLEIKTPAYRKWTFGRKSGRIQVGRAE